LIASRNASSTCVRRDLLRVLAAGYGLGVATHFSRRLDAGAQQDCLHFGDLCDTANDLCCQGLLCNGGVCGAPKPNVRVGCEECGRFANGTACQAKQQCRSGCCIHTMGGEEAGGTWGENSTYPEASDVTLWTCSLGP
jgi:hypothetical protein